MSIKKVINWFLFVVFFMVVAVIPAVGSDLTEADMESVHAVLEANSSENQIPEARQSKAMNIIENLLFRSDGIVNPRPYNQRWHHDEFPDGEAFFDWNYSTVKDIEQDIHAAFAYVYVEDPSGEYTGMYLFASMIQKATNTRFFTWKKIGIHEGTFSSTSPDFKATPGNGIYQIKTIAPDRIGKPYKYRLVGKMIPGNESEEQWYAWGYLNGQEFDPETTPISWDYTVTQSKGWYGQRDFEPVVKLQGGIMWNTYVHQGAVEGHFTVGDKTVTFNADNKLHSAYIDKNWGNRFPMSQVPGDDPVPWAWGWYSFQDPEDDLSIIFGVGFNKDADGAILEALIGDIRYTDPDSGLKKHVGVRFSEQRKTAVEDLYGIELLRQSSDGNFLWHSVVREDWEDFTDDFGIMAFPKKQTLFVETTSVRLTMIYNSVIEDSLRFTIPGPGYIFSDIEGLGVETIIVLEKKVKTIFGRTIYKPISIKKMNTGGLEYGYLAPIIPPEE